MGRKKRQRLQPSDMVHSNPGSGDPLEFAYALIREAEQQPLGEEGRFRAMACHTELADLGAENPRVADALSDYGFYARIGANQRRLGIVELLGSA